MHTFDVFVVASTSAAAATSSGAKSGKSQAPTLTLSDYVQLRITVNDENEFAPQFTRPRRNNLLITQDEPKAEAKTELEQEFYAEQDYLRFTVRENNDVRKIIGRVAARDGDAGEFGVVFYYLVASSHPRFFSVERSTGTIRGE